MKYLYQRIEYGVLWIITLAQVAKPSWTVRIIAAIYLLGLVVIPTITVLCSVSMLYKSAISGNEFIGFRGFGVFLFGAIATFLWAVPGILLLAFVRFLWNRGIGAVRQIQRWFARLGGFLRSLFALPVRMLTGRA